MIALVTGGARSGKSAYAEKLAVSWGAPRWYLATMAGDDAESRARIDRHVTARAGKGFETSVVTERVPPLEGGIALLDDLPNLLAARLYPPGTVSPGSPDEARAGILQDVRMLARCCAGLVVVTGELGADGVDYPPETRSYLAALGRLSCEVAALSDLVVEVVAGCPVEVKRP